MKNIKGIRLYSNKEIKEMLTFQAEEDFLTYIEIAPSSVKKILIDYLEKKEFSIDVVDENVNKYFQSAEEIKKRIVNTEISDGVEDNFIDENHNIYEKLDFTKRLEITELNLTVTDRKECNIHNTKFIPVSAVILYGNNRRYGICLNACPLCKKLFICWNDYTKIENLVLEKDIKHKFTYEGEKNA